MSDLPISEPQARKIALMLWKDYHAAMGPTALSSLDRWTASNIIIALSSKREEEWQLGLNQCKHLGLII